MKKLNRDIASAAIVAALYVVITLMLQPLSFGVMQLRLSELFNHLAAFNRRYIFAVTLGVLIVNIFSPLGPIDMVFGTIGTLIGTTLTYYLARNIDNLWIKFTIATICQMPGMFLVALEMNLAAKLPIFPTYWFLALGEIASMVIGAVVIYLLSKKINFSK